MQQIGGHSFSSSSEVFSWLSKFVNLERGQTPKSFRLDRMEVLSELAGRPERCAPCIHIAGSKGKGSVTGMMAAMLEADGRRAARYMSPHVSDFRERISLGSSFFDEAVYCAAGDELRDIVESKVPAAKHSLFDPASEGGEAPTFFELLTLYFFLCARIGSCDVMVVETGMGGRLDSTNVVEPLVSVITLIELEHTAFLGNTIPAVAAEKAGIIKSGKPLVLAKQGTEALEIFRQKAEEKHSSLVYFPEIAKLSNVRVHSGGTDFTLAFTAGADSGPPLFPQPLDLSLQIPGIIQAENAGLAVTALKTAFPRVGEAVIRRGLERFHIPARFEKIAPLPCIIDGAHTPESAAFCIETFCSLYGEGGILIFGCAADKDAAAMAEIALPRFSKIIITTPGTFKKSDPARVYETFAAVTTGPDKVLFVQDTRDAIQQALDMAREMNLPLLGAGSFYLAAELRSFFQKR